MRLAGIARPDAFSAARTLSRDFSDRLVAETDHREDHVAIGDLNLHVHRPRLDAFKRNRRDFDDHGKPRSPLYGELNEETVAWAILYLTGPKGRFYLELSRNFTLLLRFQRLPKRIGFGQYEFLKNTATIRARSTVQLCMMTDCISQ